jgi:PAS domain S-box-containing protein
VLLGISLWLLGRTRTSRAAWGKLAARIATAVVSLVSVLSLAEHFFGRDFGIDQLLAVSPSAERTASVRPGLMSPLTATAFFLLSLALFGIDWRTPRGGWPAQYLSLSAGTVAAFGLLSFAFDPFVYQAHLSLALPTAVTLAVFSVGLVCARTEWGVGSLLCSQTMGGSLARRLLPAASIPMLVGWIRWKITATGLYSQWSVVILATLFTMALLASLIAWAAVAVDRSDLEQRKTGIALRDSEERFRLLLEAVTDYAIYMLDPEGHVASWNAGAARIKGYQTEEIVGKHFSCFYTAEDQKRGKPQQELREAIASGRFEEEGRRVRKDGSALWVNVVITPVYDPAGALRGYSKVVRDITERKLAEEALRESQDRQAGIIGSAMDAIITVDSEQRIVLFNAAAERMFRCPAAEALEQPIERFVPQRFHAVHGEHIRRFGETGTTNRAMGPMSALWAVRADGQEFQIEASISQIVTTERKLFTVILRDVTERKQAEEALRESQAQLTSVIQSAMDAIITVDDQQRVVLFNAAAEKMFRCPAAEALGQPLNHFIPQRFRSQHSEHIRRFGETGVTIRSKGTLGALWALRADGEEFQMEASISQIEARGKKLFTVIMRDVTERKQAEEALRESQAQLTGIIQSATDAILTVDGQQRIVLFNSTAEKMFGCPAQQAVGQPIERFIPQRFRAAHGGHIRRFGETGVTSRAMGTLGSLWALRVNGEEFPIEASISQIEAGGKKLFTVIIRDITERKRTDEALREQAQVLDSAQVFVRDMESRVVFWPRGAEKLYGFNPQEALGIISHDLFHTQFPEPLEMVEKKLASTTW